VWNSLTRAQGFPEAAGGVPRDGENAGGLARSGSPQHYGEREAKRGDL
jgi:hypothetical protein